MDDMKTYPIQLDDELHTALKMNALIAGKTLRQYVIDALRAIVAQKEGTK